MKDLIEDLKIRETVMKLGSGQPVEAKGDRVEADAKREREPMTLLVKELRELVEVLKSEKQAKKAPEGK